VSRPRVLVVEDEPGIREAVAFTLRGEGYEVGEEETGDGALLSARHGRWDVLLLDVMLPDLSGVEVCRRLREESDVPILLVSARDAEVERVLGLESGADDYVTKPFSMPELVSRVRALLRRRELDRRTSVVRVGAIELDLVRHEVRVGDARVAVTPTEFKLLALLASERRPFSRGEIMRHLWESAWAGDERTVDVHVKNIRQRLAAHDSTASLIETVRGVGYRLSS
jgi:two-component system response regulator RegX3